MKSSDFYDRYWTGREQGAREGKRRERTLQRAVCAYGLLTHKKGTLLEIGCGPGDACVFFASKGFAVTGVEVSSHAASIARDKGVNVVEMDIENDKSDGDTCLVKDRWDVVVALEVLEHLRDPLPVLSRLLECIHENGELVVSLPNEFHCINRGKMLLGAEPFGGHADPHLRHFGLRSLRRLLRCSKAVVCSTKPVTCVPPRFSLLLPAGALLARLMPSLFSISIVVKLRRQK